MDAFPRRHRKRTFWFNFRHVMHFSLAIILLASPFAVCYIRKRFSFHFIELFKNHFVHCLRENFIIKYSFQLIIRIMYKNIQTPNSPLSPLPPRILVSEYISEKTNNLQVQTPLYPAKSLQKQNKRRSFTPNISANMPPPSVSPIPIETESPESEFSFILKRPISSAAKLTDLMRTPPHGPAAANRKIRSYTVGGNAAGERRVYHGQRK